MTVATSTARVACAPQVLADLGPDRLDAQDVVRPLAEVSLQAAP